MTRTSDARLPRPARHVPASLAVALVAVGLASAGCAGSPTPLPDFETSAIKVLTPAQKEAALAEMEQRRNAANEAATAIAKDRVK